MLASSLIQLAPSNLDMARLTSVVRSWLGLAGVLLVLAAVVRAVVRRPSRRSPERGPGPSPSRPWAAWAWLSALVLSWGVFWALDLHRARFQIVLWLLPIASGVFVCAWRLAGNLERPLLFWACVGASAGLGLRSAREIHEEGPGLFTWLAVASWLAVLVSAALSKRRPGRAFDAPGSRAGVLRGMAVGAAVGVANVWTLAVLRSDNGCTGVSSVYSSTLAGSALLLFAFGASALARLLRPDR